MRKRLLRIALFVLLLFIAAAIYLLPRMINQRSYDRYLLFTPSDEAPAEGHPLLLYLHGSGGRGYDLSQITVHDFPFLKEGHDLPFVTLAPQCDPNDSWHPKYLIDLIDKVGRQLPIDSNRIYVTGLSMGGIGAWHLAQDYPGRIAAIVPLCGRSDYAPDQLVSLADMPVWAFHGEQDDQIVADHQIALVEELNAMGNERARLTLYPELGHNCWDTTYARADLYSWLRAQSRKPFGPDQ